MTNVPSPELTEALHAILEHAEKADASADASERASHKAAMLAKADEMRQILDHLGWSADDLVLTDDTGTEIEIWTCLHCGHELARGGREPVSSMFPGVVLDDGRWVCTVCVERCARELAQWRAKRSKGAREAEEEATAQRAWAAQHTAILGELGQDLLSTPLTEAQMIIVRKAMVDLPEKDRPRFLRILHEEARAYAHQRKQHRFDSDPPASIIDDDFVRETVELLKLGLTRQK